MPDPNFETVSSSEVPALFGCSPYYTSWVLWHAFHKQSRSMIEAVENERIRWGRLLQDDILELTAEEYKLEIIENKDNEFVRRGPLGATIDGHVVVAPGQGTIIIEAKNIDWLRWKQTWTETLPAPHVELQTQIAMHVKGAERGIIAALVGGNDLRFYEREPIPDLIAEAEDRARSFLAAVADGREPDPVGSALESSVLAALYPEIDGTKVLEDYEDEDLAIAIRQFQSARSDEKFSGTLKEQMKVKIVARANGAGIVRANGYTAFLKRHTVKDTLCEPHDEPKVIRKGGAQIRIDVEETTPVERRVRVDNDPMGI
jgi:predicted phage-related endonuclease